LCSRPEIRRCWLWFSLRYFFSFYLLCTRRWIECCWRVIIYSRCH
jgi:hypothetical protein